MRKKLLLGLLLAGLIAIVITKISGLYPVLIGWVILVVIIEFYCLVKYIASWFSRQKKPR